MTQIAERTSDQRAALDWRYEDLHAEWLAQDMLVAQIRDGLLTPGDEVDRAQAALTLAEETYRADELRRRLDDIDAARQRLDAVDYGICERCGTRIPAERLALFPTTTLCVTCKSVAER